MYFYNVRLQEICYTINNQLIEIYSYNIIVSYKLLIPNSMGNHLQTMNYIFDSTKQHSPLTGNYQSDHKFIKSKGFELVDKQMCQNGQYYKDKTNEDRMYIKDKKLYAYRIIQGDFTELKNKIKFYNDLFLFCKNGIKKYSNNSKIGSVQYYNLIPSKTQFKDLFHKISKFKKINQHFPPIFHNKVNAKLVLLLQCSTITLESFFKESFFIDSSITTNNVQFLQIFGQIIQMLSQFKSKGLSITSINPNQVYIELCNISQEQHKFSFNRLFYYPTVFHRQKQLEMTYFSPEEFQVSKNIQQKSCFQEENQKDVVFSLGLILLSILIKKPCNDCYNFNSKQFCRSLLQQRIDILQKKLLNLRQEMLKKQLHGHDFQTCNYFNESFEHILFSMISQMLTKKEHRTISTLNQVKRMYHQLTRCIYSTNIIIKQINKQPSENSLICIPKYKKQINEQTALTQSVVVRKKKLQTVKKIMTQGKQNYRKLINEQEASNVQIFKTYEEKGQQIYENYSELNFNANNQVSNNDLSQSINWLDQSGNIIQPITNFKS